MTRRSSYLFADQRTIHDVILARDAQLAQVLAGISNADLRDHSIEHVTSELAQKFRLDVPVLDRSGIRQLPSEEVSIDVSGAQNRAFFEPGPHYVTGTSVRISIPFNGEPDLFRYPFANIGSAIPGEVVNKTVILEHHAEHPDEAEIKREFDNRLSRIETALEFIRGPVEPWNQRLADKIRSELQKRKEKLERDERFTLGYPKAPQQTVPVKTTRMAAPENYDLFLSHASEDKESVARPLYFALTSQGVSVWFDEARLKLGDSLRQKIDEGLAKCRFGVVIVSPNFLKKHWPQRELDGLATREAADGRKVILPVWHQMDHVTLARSSPTLADRVAGTTEHGIGELVKKILDAMHGADDTARTETQNSTLPREQSSDLELLRDCLRRGTPIFPSPILPQSCARDQFHLTNLDARILSLDKGTGQEITIPLRAVTDILPDSGGRPFRLLLNGRLQWVSVSRRWKYFPERPETASQRRLGFEKISSLSDPRAKEVVAILEKRGTKVTWANENRLPDLLGSGKQIVYDDDGLYFRIPSSPTSSILIASGP